MEGNVRCIIKGKKVAFFERLRNTMKTLKIVSVLAGIRIWYLPKSVLKHNAQFVFHNSIIIIRFQFVLHVSAPFPANIRYYI
jgi:hypothetical protein